METIYWWLLAAVLLLIGELLTPGFVMACFSLGAFLALIPSALGLGLVWEIVAFCTGSLLALFLLRPFVRRISSRRGEVRTAADALIGRQARVTECISAVSGKGRVAIDGDDFPARIDRVGNEIPVGTLVEVIRRESIVLIVRPIER